MADFTTIKQEIDQRVNTNGANAVTGAVLNEVLKDILDAIDAAKQDTLESGVNIKTVNGNDVTGAGDCKVLTFQPFPSSWPVNGTTKELCDAINADTDAVYGMAYLGEVHISDMPAGLVNAEIQVEVIGDDPSKVIHLIITSGNQPPYRWEYTYWNDGHSLSGWIGFANQ